MKQKYKTFWMLKYQDFLLFSVLRHCKLNIFGVSYKFEDVILGPAES